MYIQTESRLALWLRSPTQWICKASVQQMLNYSLHGRIIAVGVDLYLDGMIGEADINFLRHCMNAVDPVVNSCCSRIGAAGPNICLHWMIRAAGVQFNAATARIREAGFQLPVPRQDWRSGCQLSVLRQDQSNEYHCLRLQVSLQVSQYNRSVEQDVELLLHGRMSAVGVDPGWLNGMNGKVDVNYWGHYTRV